MNAHTLTQFPEARIDTAHGTTGYREAGAMHLRTLPVVLLHGIGSGAASWVRQLETLGATRRVLAWDAPGYGVSTRVAGESPVAPDYANALAAWLDALAVDRCVLVGHSLGAIIAGSFAARAPERVAGLQLISPAAGYGAASKDVRESKRDARLQMLAGLGPEGLARERSANMLSPHADEAAREWVRWNMARIVPEGYAQATHLLANADLAADLARFHGRIAVAVGAEDGITPPAACERIAQAARVSLQVIPRAGHAGYVESPAAYTALIDAFCHGIECQMKHGVMQ
jgi:pimeloyl-ACP methyl ester carboxylesterase